MEGYSRKPLAEKWCSRSLWCSRNLWCSRKLIALGKDRNSLPWVVLQGEQRFLKETDFREASLTRKTPGLGGKANTSNTIFLLKFRKRADHQEVGNFFLTCLHIKLLCAIFVYIMCPNVLEDIVVVVLYTILKTKREKRFVNFYDVKCSYCEGAMRDAD